jgi:hypothetical protein
MQKFSTGYRFTQRFGVPARKAFEWSTDYRPTDLVLMGEKGTRRIKRVTEDTIILEEEVIHGRRKNSKVKLVKLNPRTLSWHNIHLEGPNKHSEFIYEIVPEGKRKSKLTFTGLLVVYSKHHLSSQDLRRIADSEKRSDSKAWKRLAGAMKEDFSMKP